MKQSIYLDRYAWKYPIFDPSEYRNADIIVVIPAYKEAGLEKAIDALQKCEKPKGEVLISVIVNEPEDASETIHLVNQKAFDRIQIRSDPFPVLSRFLKLPKKKAGVGLARKIGMDEAVRIFNSYDKSGIITCFDADCTCETNFLIAIENHFKASGSNTALAFYEHPLDEENSEAIVNYELYLRYYVDALRWSGFPYAFQTLGSCISVRSSAYELQGGMNTRKAGEDFYFIHKMTSLGMISEINDTTVFPSDRLSDRVPFGTGHAINKYLKNGDPGYPVYAPMIFDDLKKFLDQLESTYSKRKISQTIPPSVATFLASQDFGNVLHEIILQTTDYLSFRKRFFQWFDGLKVLQYVHFCRDHHYKNVLITEAIQWLNQQYLSPAIEYKTKEEALLAIRKIDRKTSFYTR